MENVANIYTSQVPETRINTPLPRTQTPHLPPASYPPSSLPSPASPQPLFPASAFPCPAPVAEALQHKEPGGLLVMLQKQYNPVAFLDAHKEGNEQPLV